MNIQSLRGGVRLKSAAEIELMREAGKINFEAHMAMRDAVRPGVATIELDAIAAQVIKRHGATPAFLGYPPGSRHPFPAVVTVCINEELVHGIPGKRVLKEGDIVTLDCGTEYKGYVGDSAYTWPVGKISVEAEHLLRVTEDSLTEAISKCVVGNRLGDVSHAVESFVARFGFTVPREYGGHGVGRQMHEDPHIPNWGEPGKGIQLRRGMTFAVEPMVMMGQRDLMVLNDHWTVVPKDRKLCAHFEHTIAVTDDGPDVLTRFD
ncbi:MAG: type I methionyl aminopeptidase [Anaerolineae bacterium]|nr:type I methionyl aminopeptidase [Anaerolineae bacterium]